MTASIHQTIDHLFRHESGKMIAVLSKLLGLQQLHLAQDIVQDTLLKAMTTWAYKGVPENPTAWLYRVAKNSAVDIIRREKTFRHLQPELQHRIQSEYTLSLTVQRFFDADEIMDSQLRMMFACCHPSIPPESQMALILKTLCGLSNTEIAKAFLKEEESVAKRIYRAREKIRSENISLDLPSFNALKGRLAAVQHSLYLLFNEGYNSSNIEYLIREDLCEEAMRLTYLLTQYPATNSATTQALLALFCFQASRLNARLDDKGNIILLKYQDRKLWYKPLIQKGNFYLEKASDNETSVYHIEAAIAWLHATAADFDNTNWAAVYHLYTILEKHHPSRIVSLNKAIAAAYALDRNSALMQLKAIRGLENYYLYHAALGEIYFDEAQFGEAKISFCKALSLAHTLAEQQFIRNKIAAC